MTNYKDGKTMDEIFEELSSTTSAMVNFAAASVKDYNKYYEEDDEPEKSHKKKTGNDVLGDIADFMERSNIKNHLKPILIGIFLTALTLYNIRSIFLQGVAFYYVDYTVMSYSIWSAVVALIPFGVFALSTLYSYWNFHKQKMFFFSMCLLNFALLITRIVFRLTVSLIVPILLKLPINSQLTKPMVVFLMRFLTGSVTIAAFAFIVYKLYNLFFEHENRKIILGYRLYIDNRQHQRFLYDLKIIRHMEDGSFYKIREDDRIPHTLIDGASGTGKTAMTMLRQVNSDLDKKVLNEDCLKRELLSMLKKGMIYLDAPISDSEFNINHFKAKQGYEALLDKVSKKYKSCGITFVAPDEETTDEVYDLCVAKGIKCNRIDPIKVAGKNYLKPGAIGCNPFYISSHIPDWDRNREIIKKATLFADVIQFINEMKGKGSDPYFQSVNRSVTTAFTILLEKTYPILNGGAQPTPEHLQLLVNNFERVRPYYNVFVNLPDVHEFEFVKDFLDYDILGDGAKDMLKHSNGLKTILNEFLTNPMVRSILCAENSVDMDKMLADGEATVVNYALQLGTTDSVALGLFFVLSFNDAVIRRPGNRKTRLPHYYLIDELPILLHPQIERCFSLFRKYKVAMTVAIQSFDQMEKSETTRYLKGVILGCGHHIVFGRAGVTEMKLYQELAGVEMTEMSQNTVSETSITTQNPNYSYSSRTTPKETNITDGTDIRNRRFQEVTVFSLENNSLVRPFHGKVDFLTPKDRRKLKRFKVDWDIYYEKNSIPFKDPEEDITKGRSFVTPSEAVSDIPLSTDANMLWSLIESDGSSSKAEQEAPVKAPSSVAPEALPKVSISQTSSFSAPPDGDIFDIDDEDEEILVDSEVQ